MLVLFTGKSRASCRFVHSYGSQPSEVQPRELGADPEGLTKSCIFSGLERWHPIARKRESSEQLCPKTGLAPLTIAAEPSRVASW
jgi:hypothetical protein